MDGAVNKRCAARDASKLAGMLDSCCGDASCDAIGRRNYYVLTAGRRTTESGL